jgi:geranylgeranyl diphosphate synthase type II
MCHSLAIRASIKKPTYLPTEKAPALATVPTNPRSTTSHGADVPTASAGGSGNEHLNRVPETKALREKIRREAIELAAGLDKSRPLGRHEMETHARQLSAKLELPEAYLGWVMVILASAFWKDQVSAVPCDRRLLLLPRCLRSSKSCKAEYNDFGLLCEDCGACDLTNLRTEARRRGYTVMIAEGSPAVMKIILGGGADALMGVACLDVLEKTVDKILLAGIPCMAVPLLSDGCSDTVADVDWVREMFDTPHRPAAVKTRTYVHLLRSAARMFEPEQLDRLAPRTRGGSVPNDDPIGSTESLAYDFLTAGGKHLRPFITLAVYDALRGDGCTGVDGARLAGKLPDHAKRMALAIEIFHKASLVHDDIEDDDAERYGRPTLHRTHGSATAINVGDYLIGLGYRTVGDRSGGLSSEVAADIFSQFAAAHTRLCEGQGAELFWRDAKDKQLSPLDALKIYALKTAPAFEAALMTGVRLALPAEPFAEPMARFSRHLGVAYQILNDLDNWQDPESETPIGGSDLLGGRPTVLWALAIEGLGEKDRERLKWLVEQQTPAEETLAEAAELYRRANVFTKATELVVKHRRRAEQIADQLEHEPLRYLLHFLTDAILDRRSLSVSEE